MKILGEWKSTTVYAIEHLGKIVYVGKTSVGLKSRIHAHWGHANSKNGRLRNLCPKLYPYLRNNPNKEEYAIRVLGQFSGIEADAKEIEFISLHKTRINGLNVSPGGNSSSGEDHYLYKKKISRHIVEASIAARIGKPLSEETKAKQRAAAKLNRELRGGPKESSHLNDPEIIAKRAETMRANRLNRKSNRKIKCDQTGEIWPTLLDCANHHEVTSTQIYQRMKFKNQSKFRRSSKLGKFTFTYA